MVLGGVVSSAWLEQVAVARRRWRQICELVGRCGCAGSLYWKRGEVLVDWIRSAVQTLVWLWCLRQSLDALGRE